jgi:hypothetical protein
MKRTSSQSGSIFVGCADRNAARAERIDALHLDDGMFVVNPADHPLILFAVRGGETGTAHVCLLDNEERWGPQRGRITREVRAADA